MKFILKKSFTVFFLASLFLFSFGIFSCSSTTGLAVPGENETRRNNITAEYFSIAESYESLKNYSKAIEYYKLAMADSKMKNTCLYKCGRCYALNKDYKNALELYKILLKDDAENTNLLLSTAYLEAMCSNFSQAEKIYSELLEKNPQLIEVYKNYISVLIVCEKKDKAREVLDKMAELFPDDSSIAVFEKALSDEEETKSE